MCVCGGGGGEGGGFLLFFSPPLGICAKAGLLSLSLVICATSTRVYVPGPYVYSVCVCVCVYIYISGQRGVVLRPKRMYIHHVSSTLYACSGCDTLSISQSLSYDSVHDTGA